MNKSLDKTLQFSQPIDILTAPEQVWGVLTEPKLIQQWLFGTETITDWKVGSPIIFQGVYDGHRYQDKGVVRINQTNRKLVYGYWAQFSGLADEPNNYAEVAYLLEPISPIITRFTWQQTGFVDDTRRQHTAQMTGDILQQIKQMAERG